MALLLDLGNLVIDAQDHIAHAELEGLRFPVFAVACVFARTANEAVLVEVDFGQAIYALP